MLFDLPKNDPEEKQPSAGATLISEAENVFPSSYKLEDTVAKISPGKCVHWLSDNDWSMHDMLLALLQLTGPAHVYISSYAFSEYPAKLIASQIADKRILSLHCLIDKRIDVRSASALAIITNMATRLKLVMTHAKVTIIENENMMVTVIGSANYTSNKRYETGIVIMDHEVGNFHKKWITDAFNRS